MLRCRTLLVAATAIDLPHIMVPSLHVDAVAASSKDESRARLRAEPNRILIFRHARPRAKRKCVIRGSTSFVRCVEALRCLDPAGQQVKPEVQLGRTSAHIQGAKSNARHVRRRASVAEFAEPHPSRFDGAFLHQHLPPRSGSQKLAKNQPSTVSNLQSRYPSATSTAQKGKVRAQRIARAGQLALDRCS